MKRFLSLAVAVLLGLASAQDNTTTTTNTTSPSLQGDFDRDSAYLSMPWDAKTMALKAASCKVYTDLTLFDLQPIRGPYYVQSDLSGDTSLETLEVHFCNPVSQSDVKDAKASLIFTRELSTADDNLKRKDRITSGSMSFESKTIQKDANGVVTGIKLAVKQPGELTEGAKCNGKAWSVSFNIMCDKSETK
jgi:hypothetical protein